MFYQILPQSYYHAALPGNSYAPNCIHTLQSLKYALEKSVTAYADSLQYIQETSATPETNQESREYHKIQQECAHSPTQSQSTDKLSQKDEHKLSIKINTQPLIEEIIQKTTSDGLSTERQQNEKSYAQIGQFSFGVKQRLKRLQSLLSRRVDEFKTEKPKRRSNKIVYHWY